MNEIKVITMKRAFALLDACQCSYAVIDPDGNKHGNLELAAAPSKRRSCEFPFGSIMTHIRQHLPEMNIGDVVQIPAGEYGAARVRATAVSFLCKKDGKNAYTSTITGGMVEIMRIG